LRDRGELLSRITESTSKENSNPVEKVHSLVSGYDADAVTDMMNSPFIGNAISAKGYKRNWVARDSARNLVTVRLR
jgi:hypothetical protein